MTTELYPSLGFDPCPGDVAGYEALAAYASRSAATLSDATRTLAAAGSDQWRGQAADAFRSHVHVNVVPLARQAADSVGGAAVALHEWAITLAGLRDEARALDRQAAPHQVELTAVRRAVALSSSPALTTAQQARVAAANGAMAVIAARAGDIHARYLTAVQRTGSQLKGAGNLAPRPPGPFAGLWHGAEAGWGDAVGFVGHLAHDKGLLEFISGVANILATVAGLLALIPPLSLVFAPVALGFAAVALAADVVLAGFDHGSWGAVILDAGAVVGGAGWITAADKLSEMFKASGLTGVMTKAPTWAGVVSKVPGVTRLPVVGSAIKGAEKSVEVAPGMFAMIGASLREAGGDGSAVKALSAVKDFEGYAKWRGIDIVSGQGTWALSGAGVEAIPGTVRAWVNKLAEGKPPWQESPATATAG